MGCRKWWAPGLGAVFLLVACGSSDAPGAKVTPTTTVVTTVTTQPSQTQPSQAQSSHATPAQPSVQSGVVPDVVGMNHQLAQDTMQAAGFYFLTEEDATGQGRLLINDRNWTVVSQDPKGGTRAPADTKIVLRSKKIGE